MLSENPDLLFILRAHITGAHVHCILRLFGLSYNVFRPFLEHRDLLEPPFPPGDSPLDFLLDPQRAGDLHLHLADVTVKIIIRWISHTKELIVANDGWFDAYVI
jgi:hypothetical protein